MTLNRRYRAVPVSTSASWAATAEALLVRVEACLQPLALAEAATEIATCRRRGDLEIAIARLDETIEQADDFRSDALSLEIRLNQIRERLAHALEGN